MKKHICGEKKVILLEIPKNKLIWNYSSKVCPLILVSWEKNCFSISCWSSQTNQFPNTSQIFPTGNFISLSEKLCITVVQMLKIFWAKHKKLQLYQRHPSMLWNSTYRNSIYRKITCVYHWFSLQTTVSPRVTESWFNPRPLFKCVLYPHTAPS